MKRKRGARRKPQDKSSAAPSSAGPANSGFLNEENNSHIDGNGGVDSVMKSGTAQSGGTGHHQEERFLGEVNAGNSTQKGNLMTNVASFAAKLSRAVGSPSAELTTNSPAVHDTIMQEEEPGLYESDHLNNEKELNEALSVIKRIMRTESAKPFSLPVDPVALGIPDYLEVIEKPMDFGTICNNIEWGGKYRNSKDVYTDVQLIWNNCAMYNKKGDYILDLMRRVKMNFEKIWNAAGLFSEEREVEVEANLKKSAERPTKTSKEGNVFPSGSTISKSIQQEKHENFTGLRQAQGQKSLPSFSHVPTRHLSPDYQGEWQSLEVQSLHPPGNGHLPTTESTAGHKLHTFTRRGGLNNLSHNSQQRDEDRPWREQSHQPSASHASKSHPNERPYMYSQQQDDYRPWKEPSHQPSDHYGSRIHQNERPYQYSQQQVENRPSREPSHQPSASHGSRIHHSERPYTYSQQQDDNRLWKEVSHQPSASHASQFHPYERPQLYQPSSSKHHYTSNPAATNNHSAGHFHGVPSSSAWENYGNNQFRERPSLVRCSDQHQPLHKSYGRQLDSSEMQNPELDARDLVEEDPHRYTPVESAARHVKSKKGHPVAPVPSHSHQQQFQNGLNEMFQSHSNGSPEKNSARQYGMGHPEIPQTVDMETTSRAAPAESTAGRHSKSQAAHSPVIDDSSDDDADEEAALSESHSDSDDTYLPNKQQAQNKLNLNPTVTVASVPPEQSHFTGTNLAWPVKGRGRGPTKALKWLHEGTRLTVITNEVGQAVCENAPKLITFLGILARDGHLAPLTNVDWRAMPQENKEKMWNEVQAKFIIDPDAKKWVIKSLGRKWKDWKAKLKMAHYIPHTTDEERLADRDERVLPDQWEYLVSHWSSEQAEKRSSRNKANRAKQRFRHVTGTKSHARIREEERAKRQDGKPPSRAELFILTRTRKDGKPVNEDASAVIKQLNEMANEQNNDTPGQVDPNDDEVFCQIIGPNRCAGLGPSPAVMAEVIHSKSEAVKLASDAKAEVSGVKDRLAAMEQTCSQMAQQMSTMMAMIASMQQPSMQNPLREYNPEPFREFDPEPVPSQVGDAPETSEASPDQQGLSTSFSLRRSSRRTNA